MKKILTAFIIIVAVTIMAQTSAQQKEEWKPKNLKVLPKNTSDEEIHAIMRTYSKSLGVRCGFCHKHTEGEKPDFDFASDEKQEKLTARKMIKMVDGINKKYIAKIGEGKFEKITCVTCHMGNTKPIVSADSLPKKERPQEKPLEKPQEKKN
jgi:hypothetical protein